MPSTLGVNLALNQLGIDLGFRGDLADGPPIKDGMLACFDERGLQEYDVGDSIVAWRNASSYDFGDADGTGHAPTVKSLGDRKIASFNGSSQYFVLPSMSSWTEGSAFAVFNNNAKPIGGTPGFWHLGTPSFNAHLPWPVGQNAYDTFGSTSHRLIGTMTGVAYTNLTLYSTRASSSAWTGRINRSTPSLVAASNTISFPAVPYVGRSGLNAYFHPGDIAAVVLYDRYLSDDERDMVEGYLTTKYGIA